jgi:hypothetical protein
MAVCARRTAKSWRKGTGPCFRATHVRQSALLTEKWTSPRDFAVLLRFVRRKSPRRGAPARARSLHMTGLKPVLRDDLGITGTDRRFSLREKALVRGANDDTH